MEKPNPTDLLRSEIDSYSLTISEIARFSGLSESTLRTQFSKCSLSRERIDAIRKVIPQIIDQKLHNLQQIKSRVRVW